MDSLALRDLLISWSEINSGSSHAAGLARMRAALAAEFTRIRGAEVSEIPLTGIDARALRIRQRPAAAQQVLLSGHYDTVYNADHPFQRCEQLDAATLRGPGVADMKGGIVVLLAALQAFEHSPHAAQLGWEVLLTPDEETGSVASRPVIEAAAKRFALALIFEPARESGDLVQSRKGTGIFTVTCHGRAAHAGRAAGDGRNAIVALAEFLIAADQIPKDLPGVLLNIGSIHGGGAVNIVPDLARAELNLRITRAAEATSVIERLRSLAAPINAREGFRLEIAGEFNRLPMEATPASTACFESWQRCAAEVGAKPISWVHVGGGSDGNLLAAAGLPCLDGLGPVGGHLHSADEYILLPSLAERAQIAARFLEKLAAGEIALPARL